MRTHLKFNKNDNWFHKIWNPKKEKEKKETQLAQNNSKQIQFQIAWLCTYKIIPKKKTTGSGRGVTWGRQGKLAIFFEEEKWKNEKHSFFSGLNFGLFNSIQFNLRCNIIINNKKDKKRKKWLRLCELHSKERENKTQPAFDLP